MTIRSLVTVAATLALLTPLTACDRSPSGDTPGNTQDQPAVDPALGDALGNQIVVDPARTRGQPEGAGSTSATRAPDTKCTFHPDKAWAGKLPVELPLYPGARLTEAAGSDAPGCRRRIVSFASGARPAAILEYYRGRVAKAGYSVEHLTEGGNDVLGGTRGEAAYYVSIAPAGTGSTVDLIANTGG